ncbi:unnamed protein product [Leuciscus chuanchicus]
MMAPMNEKWSCASATSLQGRIYICGGFTGTEYLSSAESFNPETNQWTLIAPMTSRRISLGVIAYADLVYAVVNGQLFAVGGFNGLSNTSNVERYDEKTDQWFVADEMAISRSALSCCVASGLPNMAQYAALRDTRHKTSLTVNVPLADLTI